MNRHLHQDSDGNNCNNNCNYCISPTRETGIMAATSGDVVVVVGGMNGGGEALERR